jgi:NADPH2:quinone reductase
MADHVTRIVTAPEPGGPDASAIEERRLAPAGPGEVLIDVAGAGINRPDIFERMGFYPPPPGAPEGLGLEVSGIVREAGPGADFKAGDQGGRPRHRRRLCRYRPGQRGRAPCPRPKGVDLVDAGGLPETVMTVFANVFMAARLQPGERFLVHGGASGIGTTAVQMAKAHGCTVMATAGSAGNANW